MEYWQMQHPENKKQGGKNLKRIFKKQEFQKKKIYIICKNKLSIKHKVKQRNKKTKIFFTKNN